MGKINYSGANKLTYQSQGFSLVEVLIVIAVMGVVMTLVTRVTGQLYSQSTRIEDKQVSLDLKNIITQDLSNDQACRHTFAGRAVNNNPLNINQIRDPENEVLVSSNSNWSFLNIYQMTLENVNVPNQPNSSGRMNLEIPIGRERGAGFLKSISVPISVRTDSSGRIASCNSLTNQAPTQRSCESPPLSRFFQSISFGTWTMPHTTCGTNLQNWYCRNAPSRVALLGSQCNQYFQQSHVHGQFIWASCSTGSATHIHIEFICVDGNWFRMGALYEDLSP
jgi:prepilin-type N-terminal cleavage/methylation domain-containing protein